MAKNFKKHKLIIASLFVGLICLIAGVFKILHPAKKGFLIYEAAGGMQLFYAFILPMHFRSRATWAVSLLCFSSYFGYSLYMNLIDKMCMCFGSKVQLPPLYTFSILGLLITLSVYAMWSCGCKSFQRWMLLITSMVLSIVIGFMTAGAVMTLYNV